MDAEIIVTICTRTILMIEDIGLLVEAAGTYPSLLLILEVVGTHHVTKIVYNSHLKGILSGLKIVLKLYTVWGIELCCDVLAVDAESYRIHSSTRQHYVVIGAIKLYLAGKSQLTCKLCKAGVIELRGINAHRLISDYRLFLDKEGLIARHSRLTIKAKSEVTDNVYRLDLHIVGETILHTLKGPGLGQMLVARRSLLYHRLKGNHVLTIGYVGSDIELSEGAVAEVTAVGLIYLESVDVYLKYLGSLGSEVYLGGYRINGEAVILLKCNSPLKSVDSGENI